MNLRRRWVFGLGVIAAALFGVERPARASILVNASINYQELLPPASPPVYQYQITLNDTGTTNIETFWYAWIPGQDYMAPIPSSIVSPTNWTESVTHGGIGDGYAIQWTTTTAPLTPGNSLDTFEFDSTSTPAQIFGDSQFYPTTLVNTSFVYAGAPLSATSFRFVAPEPASATMLAIGFGGLLARRKR